ncbi:MAG: HD domain-containing protein [Deltaproteobacteria bacterium]|nr:HD domain-containing protein [Deltaproteobacteria bacterium]MBW2071590.1 HD domain-containing protein [Deltaproteobacteria bacterium]
MGKKTVAKPLKQGIRIRLHTKFMIGIIILECLLMTATILVVEHRMRDSILDEFLKRGLSVAKNLAAVNANYVATYNYVNIEQSVEKIRQENGLAYAMVLLFDGEVAAYSGRAEIEQEVLHGVMNNRALKAEKTLVQYGTFGMTQNEYCDITSPILLKGEKWGTVRVGFSLKDMHAAVLKTRKVLFALGLVAVVTSCFCCLLLARRITRPIGNLVESVEAISNGEYEREIHITTNDEIGYLGSRFAAMQKTLREHIELLTDTNLELTQSNQRLQSLFQLSQAMNAFQHQDNLYDLILEAALTATGAVEGSLTLVDHDYEVRVVAAAGNQNSTEFGLQGRSDDRAKEYHNSHESLVSGAAVRPLLLQLQHFQKDMPFCTMQIDGEPELELLSIPLQQGDRLLGFINLTRRRKDEETNAQEMKTLSILSRHATASLENKKLFIRLEEAYLSSIRSLAKTLEFKDQYTHGHAERVAEICMKIGKRMKMDKKSLKILHNAALLHDIGKIGIMEKILNKGSSLEASEWNEIKKHPVFGEEILKPIFSLREECKIVRHHHEREDGRGYPDGLYGNRLSLSEKIIIVADAFDAMNSKRAYRSPLEAAVIKEELEINKGSQFDAEVVDVLLEILEEDGRSSIPHSHKIVPLHVPTHDIC